MKHSSFCYKTKFLLKPSSLCNSNTSLFMLSNSFLFFFFFLFFKIETNIFIHQSIDKYKDKQPSKMYKVWLESNQVTRSTKTSPTPKGENQHKYSRETLEIQGGRRSPTKEANCFAPWLAN